ncbi:dihydrofolate reductase isoform X2 [Belonocnema kinseyi]|uniref:dihydrofolate reductase isoform X2 n=1 Tax=Belonocnema kinseyi TaxID=2817044 RepID=UPI00143DFB16|nr:dihydrofolate reductase isoform X2 [Belonocnema kinseyi]
MWETVVLLNHVCSSYLQLEFHSQAFSSQSQPKMLPRLNLIAATCEGMGIGINGHLPWCLKKEMAFFTYMTSKTKHPNKKNVVLMGRRTWECIPPKYRPLKNRINIVLTSQVLNLGNEAIVCHSLPEAIETISSSPLKDEIEQIWVIGGSLVYKASMELPNFHRLYLTRVKKQFECDTFFPPIPNNVMLLE